MNVSLRETELSREGSEGKMCDSGTEREAKKPEFESCRMPLNRERRVNYE